MARVCEWFIDAHVFSLCTCVCWWRLVSTTRWCARPSSMCNLTICNHKTQHIWEASVLHIYIHVWKPIKETWMRVCVCVRQGDRWVICLCVCVCNGIKVVEQLSLWLDSQALKFPSIWKRCAGVHKSVSLYPEMIAQESQGLCFFKSMRAGKPTDKTSLAAERAGGEREAV